MRVLIVGAGMAGMTLAALLEQRGVRAEVVERAPSTAHAGYMLGLYPLGSRVLHGLGLFGEFERRSVEVGWYEARDDRGAPISRWSMEPLGARFGALLSSTRPDLVEVLRGAVRDVRFGVSVTSVAPSGGEVEVGFADGRSARYDLVVGADGIGSTVRALVFGEPERYDTGWGGWVWWAPDGALPPDTFVEWWGAGRMLGAYPTRRGVGVFAGAPDERGFGEALGRKARLVSRFEGLGADALLSALPADGAELFFWRLADVRSREWVRGRVVLLGDASTGFLPTAGIGASMAMESAAVLADELSRTDARFVPHALALYEKRRRRRVERIQDDSRRLARLMFVRSGAIAAVRNRVSRHLSLETAMGSITGAFDEPI